MAIPLVKLPCSACCSSHLSFLVWNSNSLATWYKELTRWKRPCCWEGLKAGGEGDERGWDDWMASLTQWTWVWVDYVSWWWTGRSGVLRFMGSQRVGHNWATELCLDFWFYWILIKECEFYNLSLTLLISFVIKYIISYIAGGNKLA